MRINRKSGFIKLRFMFTEVFGLGRAAALSAIILVLVVLVLSIFLFFYLAPPKTITITSGPDGSMFHRTAEKYARILGRNNITLRILPSEGSVENIKRLADPLSKVDIGFVQGGVNTGIKTDKLVSLGSISYEPLFVFYRGGPNIKLLSQLTGKRVAIGEIGSGTHILSLALLAGNGIETGGPTKLLEMDSDKAVEAILNSKVDAVFLMGDSVSTKLIRQLLHTPGIKLFDFTQADAYTRRISYLNKITLPRGSIDFGKDIPAQDFYLLAPTVELIAREYLHPALSDLLIEAAHEVHSGSGLIKRKDEFPAPIKQDIHISDDAVRFYKSGKSFFYRYLPFGFASHVNRLVVVLVPMLILLLPGLRLIPVIYKWRFRSRIFRWYRALMVMERDIGPQLAPDRRKALMERLDNIEEAVSKMKMPASFADQFYDLRLHITFVRNRFMA
ncbi:MAG: C4-dicarboxylate ABC transporter substrate-binding protein [Proteobacteria bacterium]|nr:C4-dicarboxylate ABC transporter substrate-binding protein [Pseudomonadota bacterium]